MNLDRFRAITDRYSKLTIAVLGDFCLDRYLEIDPARQETSIETGLAVYNVASVRAVPGGAGTVLNNLAALGVGRLLPIGLAGDDGEGFELTRALRATRGVELDSFLQTPLRRTFTYCKPLIVSLGEPPQELNRLDSKNWTPTPREVEDRILGAIERRESEIDALIVMEQVDLPETGVVTRHVRDAVGELARRRPGLFVVADSRRGLGEFEAVSLKMNRAELGQLLGTPLSGDLEETKRAAAGLAKQRGRTVFVTLSECGIIAAAPNGETVHLPILPLRGPIDIVGAGDSVTANLTAAQAAGASLDESLELANAASSIVIHKLGQTGTASIVEMAELLMNP